MELASVSLIAGKFAIDGTVNQVSLIKTGHIHHSYKIQTDLGAYFLQQINHHVFPDVAGMMKNIALVTATLKSAFENTQYQTLTIILTRAGNGFLEESGEYWRMYEFQNKRMSYDTPPGHVAIEESAQALVAFTQGLQQLSPNHLTITIPRFHSMRHRLAQLEIALNNDRILTTHEAHILAAIQLFFPKLIQLEEAWEIAQIPTRIIHNDTKLNNLLFDINGKARCLVDLDTVMPGIVHFDVGDALRTMSCQAREDEENPDLVVVNDSYYQLFLDAYKNASVNFLTPTELDWLPFSAPYMALIMAIRFFTDHLNGNTYFHCQYPTHNLVRASNQVSLTKQFILIENLY